MKIFLATDFTLSFSNNRYYLKSAMASILKRYHDAFGEVVYCSRMVEVESSENLNDVTEMISSMVKIGKLWHVPFGGYRNQIIKSMRDCDLVICRVPSIIAYMASDCAIRLEKPYLAESMGCAWDAYWNHGFQGKLIAPYMYFKMKKVVLNANYAVYVTNKFLQNRYPCRKETISASNVEICAPGNETFKKRLDKINTFDATHVTLMTSAAVNVKYKGQQFAIRAIPKLNKYGINVRYILAGGGDQRYLRSIARKMRVEAQVEFLGHISLEKVQQYLDASDIYIQPSLQEGLPRAIIEAMSRGCPCIGAKTGGIPELIAEQCVFTRKSALDITETILQIYNKNTLSLNAKANYEKSYLYLNSGLAEIRNAYFEKIIKDVEGKTSDCK